MYGNNGVKYGEIDGNYTELSVYGDKFLKFMGNRVSQVAFYCNSRVNFGYGDKI